ncbi:hypothetical protein D9M68_891620 [compost metagenome]
MVCSWPIRSAKLLMPVAAPTLPISRNSAGSARVENEASRAAPMPSKELPTSMADTIRAMRASPSV